MKKIFFEIPCLCSVLMFTYSCSYDRADLEINCLLPDTVSFQQDIQPIFDKNCTISGCHSGATPSGNLNLESSVAYTQLMNSGSGYIDTINPKYSVLHASMNSTMPPTGKLDKCKTDLVLKWIQQKAKNN